MSAAIENLRTATDIRLLIERRDPRAWPLALKLAEMFQEGCLRRMLRDRGPATVFVPRTETDLVELFGEPTRRSMSPKRGTALRAERARRPQMAHGPFAGRAIAEGRL